MDQHKTYMQRCLQLAALGAGHVAPNPMVGAVLVFDKRIIGEGYHQQYGGPHAEVNCLTSVKEADKQFINQSTLYVSLEPCAHFGKTPPCANLIIENKIQKVVIGCRDPFDAVNGKGIELLENAGNAVELGILEKECMEINKRFFTFHTMQRPYVILKWAQSRNGMIATDNRKPVKISNPFSDRIVHQWRAQEAGIMVGTQTVLSDNPRLNVRLAKGNNPVRIIIDKNLRLPNNLHVFDNSQRTIIINNIKHEEKENLRYIKVDEGIDLPGILKALHAENIQSVLVEGGAKLLQSFIDSGLWDEARIIENTTLDIPEGLSAPVLKQGQLLKQDKVHTDQHSFFKNQNQ